MRMTSHTDYGLRLLMISADSRRVPVSVGEAALRINVPRHHLMKVAQGLSKAGIMEPVRGRSGGFRLAKAPRDIRIGDVIRALESEMGLVECVRSNESECPLLPGCRLPRLLGQAKEAFLSTLDTCTLHDLVSDNQPLIQLSEKK